MSSASIDLMALLRKLLTEDESDHNAYVSRPGPWPTGGYTMIIDHGVTLTDEEAEFVRQIQAEREQ